MNAKLPVIYKIDLEPAGQDFRTFFVEAGRIVHVEPAQGWAWCGKQLDAVEFAPGDTLRLQNGPLLTYRVAAAATVAPRMTYAAWLMRVDQVACRATGNGGFSREHGAGQRGDPWLPLYLAEMTPEEAFARCPVAEPA